MRYTISSSQLSHFKRESQVEFEAMYLETEVLILKTELDRALALRTGPGEKSLKEQFLAGHDLQRENPPLIKALSLSRLGQIGAFLFQKKRLRAAFTQYMLGYPAPSSIDEISSLTETCGGVIIDLTSEEKGTGIFYKPDFVLPFPIEPPLLLIAFATDKARYRLREKDPHTHALKSLGYGMGDRITTETHPLIVQ